MSEQETAVTVDAMKEKINTAGYYRETPKANPEVLERRRAIEEVLERKRYKKMLADAYDEIDI